MAFMSYGTSGVYFEQVCLYKRGRIFLKPSATEEDSNETECVGREFVWKVPPLRILWLGGRFDSNSAFLRVFEFWKCFVFCSELWKRHVYGEDRLMGAYVVWIIGEVTQNKCSATVSHVYGGDGAWRVYIPWIAEGCASKFVYLQRSLLQGVFRAHIHFFAFAFSTIIFCVFWLFFFLVHFPAYSFLRLCFVSA